LKRKYASPLAKWHGFKLTEDINQNIDLPDEEDSGGITTGEPSVITDPTFPDRPKP
jgi:hypothetical protein